MARERSPSPTERLGRWLRRGVLLVLVGLLVAEIGLRIARREEEANGNYWGRGAFRQAQAMGYTHAPGFEGHAVRRGEFVSPVSINRLGLRQANLEEQLAFPARLLVLGDSFAFGLGVAEREGFVARLEDSLNGAGVGVINGAQSGYSVEQERLFGMALAEDVGPDAILLSVFAGNDVQADHDRRFENIDVRFGYRLPKDRWLPVGPVDYLRTHSYLWLYRSYRDNKRERRRQRNAFEDLAEEQVQQLIQPTLAAVTELDGFCRDRGIRFGVVLIPPRGAASPFDGPLAEALDERGVAVLELGGVMTDADYFPTDGHWNASGHRKAATSLGPFVAALLQ